MSAAVRRRWPLVVVAVLAAAVALFALLGYVVAPSWLRDRLQQALGEELGRPVRVERVDVRPFALAVTVHGLAVEQRDGTPLLAVEAIEADASIASLWHRAPVVDRLRVVRPRLAFARVEPSRYNVSDLLDKWLAPSPQPARYSLNNVEIVEGRIAFDDRPVQRHHVVDGLDIGVPFLSSLPYDAQVDVQPKLAARVNGAAFTLSGHALPYADRREATLDVRLDALPLVEYVGYLPAQPRFRLKGGALTTQLTITFSQAAGRASEIALAGNATVTALDVQRPDGAPLVAWREGRVALERLDVAARSLRIASVAVEAPSVAVRRLRGGDVELAGPWFESSSKTQDAAPAPWRVEVVEATVRDGRATVEDASLATPYRATVTALEATARTLANTAERNGRIVASLRIDDEASAQAEADVALQPFAATGRFAVTGARLARLYPYAADALDLAVQRGTADYASSFEIAADGGVRLAAGTATIRDLALAAPGEKDPLWRMPELVADGVEVDVAKRSVLIAGATVRRPQAVLVREAGGAWNAERLMRTSATTGVGAGAAADATWQLRIAKVAVQQGDVRVTDRTTTPPMAVRLDDVTLAATDVGNARDRRSGLDLRARVERDGRVAVKGSFTSNPFALAADVEAQRLPLLVAKPIVERHANLVLTGGRLAARGRLETAAADGGATRVAWDGDVSLADVEALDPPTGGRLFAWRTLALERLKARSDPVEANVATIALSDFYARLIVYADGGINLAQLARTPPPAVPTAGGTPSTRPAAGAMASAAHTAERTLRRAVDGSLPIAVGKITLANGNVNFSDYFIRPNYSANLTQVAGTVSTLSPTQPGEVAITANVDNAAPVTISGRIQPFARDLSLALAGRARDIELAPLSPYAAKYAGYGITKGKLSFDVDYTIENRKLDAKNRLVLDQLTFGERVESPEATKLPVLLAVALLKDANGVIDIDLPISGTLDDPQFSVFGLIVRVVVNLIGKAATAPFALLGAIVGGGEELAYVEFGAGSAALDTGAGERLDKLAKALAQRPGLKVDVTGRVDAASDTDALAKQAVERSLRAAKVKALAGGPDAPLSLDTVTVAAEERTKWLALAHAQLPPDARAKATEPGPGEMEAALVAHHRPDDAAVAALGLARARGAKDALVARGVAAERVFLVAPKATDAAGKGGPRRVDFALR